MTPHYTLFIKNENGVLNQIGSEKRFAFGVTSTPILKSDEIGTLKQLDLVTEAVQQAILEAGIESLEDVKCVEVKAPWGVGGTLSKAASALGAAVALQEVSREDIKAESLNRDHSLYSNKTSVSAGQEQVAVKVIVMGNSTTSESDLYIGAG